MAASEERGAASVEHAGLVILLALLLVAGIAAAASGPLDGGRELGSTLARKLRCAARGPGPCWRNPLTEAYGRPLAGLVRALAPAPATRIGPGAAGLYPVDFRYCRRESCALPGDRSPRLTASNRRTTAFVSVDDRRRSDRTLTVSYWLYRPTLGWERVDRRRATTWSSTRGRGWSPTTSRCSSRSRPSPVATTTTSRPVRRHRGAGKSRGATRVSRRC